MNSGKRIEDVNQPGGAERQLQFEAAFVDSSTTMGDSYLEDIGRRWFRKAEADVMNFVPAAAMTRIATS